MVLATSSISIRDLEPRFGDLEHGEHMVNASHILCRWSNGASDEQWVNGT